MPSLSEPPAEPTAQSASTQLPQQQKKNRKLTMFIILAVLAVLALVALLLKGLLSHNEDHGDSQVVPEIEFRPLNPAPPQHTVATGRAPIPALAVMRCRRRRRCRLLLRPTTQTIAVPTSLVRPPVTTP